MEINLAKLVISIVGCQVVGYIGSMFTNPAIPGWYSELKKPGFTPPDWIFAMVWTFLFLLMGISLYFVWNIGFASEGVKYAVIIFACQMFLNLMWSVLFFGLRSPFLAFIEIFVLLAAVAYTILIFYRIYPIAAYFLIPYILWTAFAAVLNGAFWILNRK